MEDASQGQREAQGVCSKPRELLMQRSLAAWCATGDKRADATCPNVDHEPMRLESRQQPDFTGRVNFQQLFPKEKKI